MLTEKLLIGEAFDGCTLEKKFWREEIQNNLVEFILADREKNLILEELILADSTNNLSTLNGKKKTPCSSFFNVNKNIITMLRKLYEFSSSLIMKSKAFVSKSLLSSSQSESSSSFSSCSLTKSPNISDPDISRSPFAT